MKKKIKDYIKKKGKKVYINMRKVFFCTLTIISPELNTKVRYMEIFHKRFPCNNPKTFQEKLLWLKINNYNKNPLVAKCADKYTVREYVKNCGCGEILNEVYEVYDSVDDIRWELLPKQFVLKWNFGAGMNIICQDKDSLDIQDVCKRMKKWGKCKYWLSHAEMQYKNTRKKILCEAYLQDGEHRVIPDYKVYCFNGRPVAILVMLGRGEQLTTQFYDPEWNKLNNTELFAAFAEEIKRPDCLEKMLKVSEKLSKSFPFVRCDFYIVKGKLYFGELTFTPAGGFYPAQTLVNGKNMAEYVMLDI